MKIDKSSPITTKSTSSVPVAAPYRTGDVFVVQALKIESVSDVSSQLLLRFPNNDNLSAVVSGRFIGKEGDFFTIRIQNNNGNQIFAEIINKTDNYVRRSSTASFLVALNIPVTTENMKTASRFVASNLEWTSENFYLLSEALKKYPDASVEQIIMLIKNKIPVNSETLAVFGAMNRHEILIGEALLALLAKVLKDKEESGCLDDLLKNFFKNPEDEDFGADKLYFNKTIDDLIKIIRYYVKKGSDNSRREMSEFIAEQRAALEIANGLKGEMVHIQIPVNINGRRATSELYVADSGKSGAPAREHIVLLIIPTSKMGVVELFLSITPDKSVQCHFKLEDGIDPGHIRSSIIKLYDSMADIGYRLSKVTYNHIPSGISFESFKTLADFITAKKRIDFKV